MKISTTMLRRILSLTALLAIFPATRASAADGDRLRLRVLTYNVWGVPVITPLRSERMARIPSAIAALEPDVVALEEVWEEEDAKTLADGLVQAGLTYIERHSPAWPEQNGLLIASRYPLHDFRFKRYSQGRRPHLLWHVDYMSGKGVAQVKIDTPMGTVGFGATHLQATYHCQDYLFVQMSQALEAADQLDDRDDPLIFAGDINSPHDGLPARLLRARADLVPTDPEANIDQILFRDGDSIRADVVSVRRVLTEPVDLGGTTIPLSDHPGVLADLELSPCDGRCAPPTLGEQLAKLDSEVLPLVQQELSIRYFCMTRDMILAMLLPLIGIFLVAWQRKRLGNPCLKSRLAAVLLVVAAAWFTYLYTSFGPSHVEGLLGIRGRLAAAMLQANQPKVGGVLSRNGS